MEKTGIFLTGGGGMGSFQVGFFKALEEANIRYDLVCGSSVGALVGGAATYMTADEMREAWGVLSLENVLKIDSSKIKDPAGLKRDLMLIKECFLSCCRRDPHLMIDVNDIRKLLYSVVDGEAIASSPIDFGIVTTLLPSMKMQKIFKEDMICSPLEYILASIYMPIFSRQRIIDGRHYLDTSRYRRYPLEMLKEKGCNRIFVVNIEAENMKKLENPIQKYFTDGEDVTLINYEDKPSILDFSREMSEVNYQKGYDTTIQVLKKKFKN